MNQIKRFSQFYRPYLHLFYADMVCATGAAGVDLLFPLLVRQLMENMQSSNFSSSFIFKIAGIMLALQILKYFCQYFITAWGHVMGARMEYDMRNNLFNHIEKLSFSYFDNTKTGQLMSRITNDLFDIAELAHHGPEEIFISTIKILGAFGILLSINVNLTLVTFGFVPFMAIFAGYYNRKMRKVFMANRVKIAEVNSQIEDSISGIRVVKSFANEDLEMHKFIKGNKDFLKTKMDSYFYMGRFFSGIRLFEGLMYLMAATAGAWFMGKGLVKSSDVVTYLLYVNTFLVPIRTLIDFTEQFQKGMTGFQRYTEIIDTEPEIKNAPDAIELTNPVGEIEFREVSFSYDKGVHVLKDLNLSLGVGETVALVGPSGGGKSTVCSLIPRFYEVNSGGIYLDGVDIRKIKTESLRRNIGIVQQDVYLFAGSIMENIRYGRLDATDEEVVEAAKAAFADEFIDNLEQGYETYVGERGIKLSGGQKQRISIARVFLKNPKILILDEATSALDNQSEKRVQQSLAKLAENRTTFVIAHRLSTVKNADKILVLTEDGIEEEGTHEELMEKDGLYATLYNSQFESWEVDQTIL